MAEYVLVFFVVMGVATAMTIYFKRAIQARVYDARNTMLNMVVQRTKGYYTGNIQIGYEPYYSNTASVVVRSENTRREVLPSPGLPSGIFNKTIDETTAVQTHGETAAPRDAN